MDKEKIIREAFRELAEEDSIDSGDRAEQEGPFQPSAQDELWQDLPPVSVNLGEGCCSKYCGWLARLFERCFTWGIRNSEWLNKQSYLLVYFVIMLLAGTFHYRYFIKLDLYSKPEHVPQAAIIWILLIPLLYAHRQCMIADPGYIPKSDSEDLPQITSPD
jgi:hypothetical protein